MSVSSKSSTKASHVSQSTSATAEPETTSSPVTKSASPPINPGLVALAASVLQSFDTLEASLDLNIVVRPNDKAQMHAMNRVSLAALGVASDIVRSDPARFPDFSGLPASAEYVQTMTPVAARLRAFADHLDNSILNQQSPAAQQALVLYSVVKGLARIDSNQTMRDKIAELKAELVPKRSDAKPKLTKGDKAARQSAQRLAARLTKAKQFLATNDPGSLASPVVTTPAALAVASPAPKAVVAMGSATPTTSAPAPVTPAAN